MCALQEAEKALGCAPDASTIAAASKLLLDRSVERRQRVRLTWPYGGYSVEVAGDVVGGWHVRTPLQQCPTSACSSIELRVRLLLLLHKHSILAPSIFPVVIGRKWCCYHDGMAANEGPSQPNVAYNSCSCRSDMCTD